MDQINRENKRLKDAEEKRQADDLKARGEHEKIAETATAKAERAERALSKTAIKAAFVTAAAGKVADIEAAYKLADLSALEAEITGDDDEPSVQVKGDAGKVVEATLKAYPFLKPGAATTGGGMGGNVGGNGGNQRDPSKMSADEKMRAGLHDEIAKLPPGRQGLLGS